MGDAPITRLRVYLANGVNSFSHSGFTAFLNNTNPVYTVSSARSIVPPFDRISIPAGAINIPAQHVQFDRLIFVYDVDRAGFAGSYIDVSGLSAEVPAVVGDVPNAHMLINIQKSYNRKVIGLGKSQVKSVLIYADNENIEAFGMGAGLQSGDQWRQYMHTVSATIDIQTNVSDSEHDELVADVENVLKYNRIFGDWVEIVVTGSRNLSGEMRGRFRTVIDIRGKIYKPELA